jgi:hypothetical protein
MSDRRTSVPVGADSSSGAVTVRPQRPEGWPPGTTAAPGAVRGPLVGRATRVDALVGAIRAEPARARGDRSSRRRYGNPRGARRAPAHGGRQSGLRAAIGIAINVVQTAANISASVDAVGSLDEARNGRVYRPWARPGFAPAVARASYICWPSLRREALEMLIAWRPRSEQRGSRRRRRCCGVSLEP